VIDDVTRRTPVGLGAAGDAVYLLGDTRDELDGSAWADTVHDHLGGRPPVVDLGHEQRLAEVLQRASRRGLLRSAHDLSDGGLAQALVESSLRKGFGVSVGLPPDVDPFVMLFAESTGRVLVSLTPDAEEDLLALCTDAEIRLTRLGVVATNDANAELQVDGQFGLPLSAIRAAWSATIPAAMAAH
jgi:phosphoribosylformylglycinamidine synthase subunit PurL